ncbi:MAG: bifunctional folylpolyglutamate synthase/dihydrofolate synthase [Bacteroidales bacterium]|nr:bifunctional folylpolyglutamate synthase/dihydrofolate synthase [Bacteroidales bacterium]
MFAALPMFQRIGAAAYKADLSNITQLAATLGNPQNKFKSIHVAGTNGKGSTSHLLASVLQAAGYKTGLFTSPHLKDFRERIRINGEMIPQNEVINFYNNIMWGKCPPEEKPAKMPERSFPTPSTGAAAPVTPPLQPSFFEMTTALAFYYFAHEKVDIAVIEVGMGGRLDSTNIITPELSVITNISLDHTQFLGDTLEKIAIEKAGIIKQNIPVVISETQVETEQIFKNEAAGKNAEIYFADQMPETPPPASDLPLTTYQQKNFKGVLRALNVLQQHGWNITEQAVKDGFSNVCKNTGLQGRWQQLGIEPLIIADTGHNESGVRDVLQQIEKTPHENLHIVWGMVGDKDIEHILDLLPKTATYYFCCPPLPRGLNENELQKKAAEKGLQGKAYNSVQQALQAAKQAANKGDMIYIGGSNFVVAEVV